MKYYLFKDKKGMALYRTLDDKTERYIDFYPVPSSGNVELRVFNTKEEAQIEMDFLDNHFGNYGWSIEELK